MSESRSAQLGYVTKKVRVIIEQLFMAQNSRYRQPGLEKESWEDGIVAIHTHINDKLTDNSTEDTNDKKPKSTFLSHKAKGRRSLRGS
jgi:hypothetical protein